MLKDYIRPGKSREDDDVLSDEEQPYVKNAGPEEVPRGNEGGAEEHSLGRSGDGAHKSEKKPHDGDEGEEDKEDNEEDDEEEESPQVKQQLTKPNKLLLELEADIDLDSDANNFPNVHTLVVNTLIICMQDEEITVKRNVLDFMIQNLKSSNPLLNDQNKILLIEGMLNLLSNKEQSLSKRVNTWLFGKPDQESKYLITEQVTHLK